MMPVIQETINSARATSNLPVKVSLAPVMV